MVTPEDDNDCQVERFVIEAVRMLERGELSATCAREIERYTRTTTAREFLTAQAYVRRVSRILLPVLIEWVTEPDEPHQPTGNAEEADSAFLEVVVGSAPLLFALRVVIPCAAEYGQLPWELFAQATGRRKASISAMKNLLTIDKQAFHHPKLRQVIDAPQNRAHLNHAAKAMLARPRMRGRKEWKYRAMRLARRLFDSVGLGLTTTEVVMLLDTIARARDGNLRDLDMPASDASVMRNLSRDDGSVLKLAPLPDKKTLEAVRAIRKRPA